jgi:hypothetical protein
MRGLVVVFLCLCTALARAETAESTFAPTIPNKTPAPCPAPEGMVWFHGDFRALLLNDHYASEHHPWIRSHCTPEQAIEMANAAGAQFIMPVHHLTFRLSVEPLHEPIERFKAALKTNTATDRPSRNRRDIHTSPYSRVSVRRATRAFKHLTVRLFRRCLCQAPADVIFRAAPT